MSCRSVGVLPRVAASAALAVAALGVAAGPASAWGGWSGSSGGTTLTPFTQPLKIPPVLQPSRTDATTDYYNVNIQSGSANIIPGKTTPVWTYNGSFPGPTIVANKGRPVSVHVTNQLGEAMSTHLHGGHTPSIFDGLPNDHARDVTARHVWNGLAGMYIMHDAQEQALNLPSGAYDVPLIMLNRAFNSDGTMPYQDGSGDTLLVNGVPQPYMKVEARKYRFRMLNASNDDFYEMSLSNSQAMVQVANEGGLLPAPVSRTMVPLTPAERADVVIDFSKVAVGTSVKLTSGNSWRSGGDVMRFDVVAPTGNDTSTVPATLKGPMPKLSTTGAPSRTFTLDRGYGGAKWQINGHGYDTSIFDAQPKLGGIEVWTFQNNTGDDHPLHVHDVNFQVLNTNGSAPTGADASWKETVNVPSRGSVKVIAKFDDHTGTYVFHCHRLEHEDNMMMTQFKVIP